MSEIIGSYNRLLYEYWISLIKKTGLELWILHGQFLFHKNLMPAFHDYYVCQTR